MGATNFEVGLLSSIPALLAILVSIPAGQFLQKHPNRKPWIVASITIHRLGFLFVALIPFLPDLVISKGVIIVLTLIIISAPAHFFNVGWIPLLAEVVPELRRASVFAGRNILANVTNSIMTLIFGLLLSQIVFPLNFSTIYIIGWIASMISCYYIWAMKINDSPVSESISRQEQAVQIRQKVQTIKHAINEHKPFVQIVTNTFFHGFGLWAASPLYVLRYIRELNAPDYWIGYLGTITSLSAIAGMAFWRYLMPKIGEKNTLKITIVMVGIFPILVGVLPSLTPILIAAIFNGIISAGVNLSHFNTLLNTIPEKNRPGYTAIYITIMNIGAFLCPLAGVEVASLIGFSPTLILCGILSILGSSSFIWAPIKADKSLENSYQSLQN